MNRYLPLLFALSLSPAHAALDSAASVPPSAAKKPKDVTVHGDKRVDDFFWLREKENPAVLSHLRAENAYTDAVMAPTKSLQGTLYAEMLSHIKEDDVTAPVSENGYYYYTRTEKGKQYPIHCRKRGSLDASEEVLLDLNAMAEGKKFLSLGGRAVSDDARLLAYSIDENGHRDYRLKVRDLATGKDLPHDIGLASSFAWANDSDTIFFTVEEQPSKRSYQLWSYTLSNKAKKLLYEEKDELYGVGVERTRDRKWLLATSESKRTTEVRALPADRPGDAWRVLIPRETEVKYQADHRDGRFYFTTNKNAVNYRVVSAPDAAPGPASWTEVLPHRPGVKVESFDVFASYGVAYERENGLPQLRVFEFATGKQTLIPMPEPAYDAGPESNPEFASSAFRFRYESMVTPPSVYAYDMASNTSALLKRTEVPGGFDRSKYVAERRYAVARDGVKIPLSIVRRADLPAGPRPTLLYGYGSYGISMRAGFSSTRLSFLDRGGVFVIAHIRGGGELGEPWREAGRMQRKMTTFNDFADCAEFLITDGRTTAGTLAIWGRSAGGLLLGATLNLRPDLFRAAVLSVPFVDVLNTMLDASLPLTTEEYVEWGNPNVREEYGWMRAYSPYDNLAAKPYPAMLVNVSLNDSQVPYWEGAKYVAKLRGLRTDKRPLLLYSNLDAGHGGASGRYDSLRETARDYAFTLSELGLK